MRKHSVSLVVHLEVIGLIVLYHELNFDCFPDFKLLLLSFCFLNTEPKVKKKSNLNRSVLKENSKVSLYYSKIFTLNLGGAPPPRAFTVGQGLKSPYENFNPYE